MAVTRLTTNGLTGTKYDIASADNYYMEPIATTLLGSSQSSVTFSNIPQGYKHLQIRIMGRTDRGTYPLDDPWIQFNGDTGNNYTSHAFYGTGSGNGVYASAPRSNIYGVGSIATSSGSGWSGGIVDILDYTNTNKYKTIMWFQGFDTNGTVAGYGGYINLMSGSWMNTAPITSITIDADNGSYTTNSRFSLYGIKG